MRKTVVRWLQLNKSQENRRFDVAFSFAGAQRDYVEKVKNELLKYNVSVFYDNDYSVDLWGKDLYKYLAEIYSEKTDYCVIFISKEYKERAWTNHELQFALERTFKNHETQDAQEYILPVIFDDTIIHGIPKTMGYKNANEESPENLAKYIVQKVKPLEAANRSKWDIAALFEYLGSKLSNYFENKINIQINKEDSSIGVAYNVLGQVKNIITLQIIEKYIYLYLDDFIPGVNPSAILFLNQDSDRLPIKIINFSTFFVQSPEYDLSLNDLERFWEDLIQHTVEVGP